MRIIDDDHAGPVIALTGVLLMLIALPITAIYLNHKGAETAAQEIKAGTCPVRVTTACGGDICQYTAHVPCAELEELIKRNSRHDTE